MRPHPPLFLGIDFGTSGCRALIVDSAGQVAAGSEAALPAPVRPAPRRAEQDAAVWWSALVQVVRGLPVEMRAGTLIEYRLRLAGLPMGWLTRIEEWEPGRGFTDVQLRGPYARWVHRHRFEPDGAGTRVLDRVEYALPLAPWSAPVHPLLVRPALERIFAFRRAAIARRLG